MPTQIFPSVFNEDLQDFLNLIPYEVVSNVLDNITKNPEFQKIIKYIKSDDFKNIIKTMEHRPDIFWILILVQSAGLDVYKLLNTIHDLLEIVPLPVPPEPVLNIYRKKVTDIIAIQNQFNIYNGLKQKLNNCPELKALNDHIQGQDFQSKLQSLANVPVYQQIKQKLHDYGIDVDKIVNVIKDIFNLNTGMPIPMHITPSELNEDLQIILNSLPQNEIITMFLANIAKIPAFQKFANNVKLDDFKKIIKTMEQVPAFIGFLNYLQLSGFDVYGLVNSIRRILNLVPLPIPSEYGVNSLSSMVDEFITIIPHEEHKALFEEILKFSPELKALNNYICGQEFQRFVQSFVNLPQYQETKQKIFDKRIGLDKIFYYIQSFVLIIGNAVPNVGPSEELLQDFQCYMCQYFKHEHEEVSIDLEIMTRNVQFKEDIEYLKSDHFKKIIQTLNKVPAYIETLNYVQAFGLDVYRVVNTLYELLKIDPLPVPPKYGVNCLSSRLDKIVISIPCEQFKVIYEQKLKTNPELKDFDDHIRGEKFQRIVQTIVNQPWYLYMKKLMCDKGIDIDKIVYITKALFDLNTD